MTSKEIETIVQEFRNQGIEINDLDDASSYMTTTVLHRGSSIIICVNIPRLTPTIYQKVIVEPLPLLNHTVKLTYKEFFVDPERILAIASPCRGNGKITICERRQLMEYSDSPCEAPLLRGKQGRCPFLEKPTSSETRMIAPGILLVVTVHQDVPINSTCGIKAKTLTGIHLVTFRNCSMYIKNELFENYELRFEHPTILPLQLTKIKTLHIERHVNLSALHELHLESRHQLEIVDFKYKLGFASLSTIIILMLAILAFGLYRGFAQARNCSGRAILKEGRVKHRTTPTSSTLESPAPGPGPTCTSTDTETAKSATSKVDTSENVEASNIADYVTGGPSLLGARLALLGHKAGQLGI